MTQPRLLRAGVWSGALFLSAACSHSNGTPAPDAASGAYTLNSNVYVMTAAQDDAVTVTSTGLTFPAAGNSALLGYTAGDVLVGDRSSYATVNNRYGFARVIASVAQGASDTIVVTTSADASLEQVFRTASLNPQLTLDQMVELPLISGQKEDRKKLDLKLTKKFTATFGKEFAPIPIIPMTSFKIPFEVNGENATLTFSGNVALSHAKFTFTPLLDLGVQLGGVIPSELEAFHLTFGGSADVAVAAKATIGIGVGAAVGSVALTDKSKEGLAAKIQDFLASQASALNEQLNPTFDSPDLVDVELAGPLLGPIPTTFEFSAKITCSVSLKGETTYEKGVEAKGALKLGVAWDNTAGWSSPSSVSFRATPIGAGITSANLGMSVQCGLKPELAWKLAAAVGPTFSMEAGLKESMKYTETCPSRFPDNKPDGKLSLELAAYAKASVGGEVKILGESVLSFSLPPLFDKSLPLATGTYDFGDTNFLIGTCQAQPDAGMDAARRDASPHEAGLHDAGAPLEGGGACIAYTTPGKPPTLCGGTGPPGGGVEGGVQAPCYCGSAPYPTCPSVGACLPNGAYLQIQGINVGQTCCNVDGTSTLAGRCCIGLNDTHAQPCSSGNECCEGFCSTGVCTIAPDGPGQSCVGAPGQPPCPVGACVAAYDGGVGTCPGVQASLGEACTGAYDCYEVGGECEVTSAGGGTVCCLPPGTGPCSADTDCCDTRVCDPTAHTCQQRGPVNSINNGAACLTTSDCYWGYCVAGVCKACPPGY